MSKNCPAIRFLGFSNNWEILKFGDNFKLSQGIQIPIEKQYLEHIQGTERFIRIIDITQKEELPRYIHVFTNKGKINKNDIFFVRYGAIGIIGYGYTGIIANNLFKVTPIFKSNNNFLYQQFSGTSFNKKLKDMSASSSMPAINFTALKNLSVLTTSLEEQNKIATLLSIIDSKINQESSILKKLQILKKAMLEKMFPKENSNIPELRFKGFTNVWEQRKLGDNFKLSQGIQVPVEKQFVEKRKNTKQFIRIIDITQKDEPPRYICNPTGKGRVKKTDIFFVRYGAVGTIGYGYDGVIANNLFKVESLFKANNLFLFQQFSGTNFNNKLKEMSASTSMPAINFSALKNLSFYNTSYKEQEKIGELFSKIDSLITLHQRKYDKLVQVKKALLSKMFV